MVGQEWLMFILSIAEIILCTGIIIVVRKKDKNFEFNGDAESIYFICGLIIVIFSVFFLFSGWTVIRGFLIGH